jgi:hypothetical protein
VQRLRRFDEIGERKGQIAARKALRPGSVTLTLISHEPIPPKQTRARMNQINARRNRIAAEERAQGIIPRKPYRRYVGL